MKFTKKLLAVLMAVAMILSVAAVSSFAYTRNGKDMKKLVVFGDSIAAGYNLPGYKAYGQYCLQNVRVDGSFGDLVAKDLGFADENVTFYTSPGFRTKELRVFLEDDYDGDFVTQNFIGSLSGNPSYSLEVMKEARPEYQKTIADADIILLEIGFNDTWLTTQGALQDYNSTTNDPVGRLLNSPRYLYEFEQGLEDTLIQFGNQFNALVNDIYRLNPDVTLVAVGCYNPFKDWTVPDGSGIYAGQLMNFMYDNMNNAMKSHQNDGVHDFVYVDVPDTEVISDTINDLLSGNAMLSEGGWDPHPTEAGHRYMANQIEAALGA